MCDKKRRIVLSLFILLTHSAWAVERSAPVDLLQGAARDIARVEHGKISPWQKTLVFEKPGKVDMTFRAVFDVTDPSPFAVLALEKPLEADSITLNGKTVRVPLKRMRYKTIPAIPVSMLRKGKNTLTTSWTLRVKEHELSVQDLHIRLLGQAPSAFAIQTGPILGYAGHRSFTVTCRLNMPAQAVLKVDGDAYPSSRPRLIHAFAARGLEPDTEYRYTITARLPGRKGISVTTDPHTVRTLPLGDKLIFAVLGDSRTFPEDWRRVADAVVRAKPALVIFNGDMVSAGRVDHQWDEEYFGAAKDFFATIPYYAVIGNHEQDCPLFLEIFRTPNGKKNWTQTIGPVLLIGIDGDMDWSHKGKLANWLEGILAKSRAKFVFLATHYPAWSSGGHGRTDRDGCPVERSVRQMQEKVMPLLAEYGVTAMFTGHDHFYERSEPKNGVTMIVTGGAGAPLRDKATAAGRQNPYSRVFAKKHHYCLLTVDGGVCTMKAYTPEGEVLDTREWRARDVSKYMDIR